MITRVMARIFVISLLACAVAALSGCELFRSLGGLPGTVDIRVVGVVIGPCDSKNETWDGSTALTQEMISQLGNFNAKAKVASAVLTFLDSFVLSQWDAPDVKGTATIDLGDGAGYGTEIELANDGNNAEDSYRPQFPGPPEWTGVKTSKDMKVKLHLVDEDWGNFLNPDDFIADVVLDYDNLLKAYAAGEPTMINVAGQTMDLVMLVSVQVDAAK